MAKSIGRRGNPGIGRGWRGLLALAGLLVMAAAPAMAAPVTWTFQGIQVQTADQQTTIGIDGWFVFDGSGFSSWSITSDAAGVFPALDLTPSNSLSYYSSFGTMEFYTNPGPDGDVNVDLGYFPFGTPGLSTPGTIAMNDEVYNLSGTFEYQDAQANTYNSNLIAGSLIGTAATPVPEPPTWALFGGGLLLLGFVWRREAERAAGLVPSSPVSCGGSLKMP